VAYGKWAPIFSCENGGFGWGANTGNGFFGGLQITLGNWRSYGGTRYAPSPNQASPAAQMAVAELILRDQGWRAWPVCSARAGYR
jgi:hypothetical protein